MKKEYIEKTVLFLILIILFRPAFINYHLTLKTISNILLVILFLVFAILNLLLYKDRKKISIISWLLLLYELIIVFSAIYNHGSIVFACSNALKILTMVLVLEYYLKKKPKTLLDSMFIVMSIFLVINSLSILFPNTLAINNNGVHIYFLGIRTRFSDLIFPYLLVSITKNFEIKKNFPLLIFSIVISLFNIIYVKIGTAVGGIIIFSFLYLLDKKFSILKIITAPVSVFGALALNASICFFRIQNIFAFFIEKVLHENLSLTNRTIIWDRALEILKNNWILGLGIQDGQARFVPYRGRLVQAHNQILQIVYEGGILALVTYFVAIFISVTRIDRKNKLFSVCIAMLTTVIIMMTVERYGRYVYFYSILYFTYYAKELVKSKVNG